MEKKLIIALPLTVLCAALAFGEPGEEWAPAAQVQEIRTEAQKTAQASACSNAIIELLNRQMEIAPIMDKARDSYYAALATENTAYLASAQKAMNDINPPIEAELAKLTMNATQTCNANRSLSYGAKCAAAIADLLRVQSTTSSLVNKARDLYLAASATKTADYIASAKTALDNINSPIQDELTAQTNKTVTACKGE